MTALTATSSQSVCSWLTELRKQRCLWFFLIGVSLVLIVFLGFFRHKLELTMIIRPAKLFEGNDDKKPAHQLLVYPIVENPLISEDLIPLPSNRTPTILMWSNIVQIGSVFDDVPKNYYSDEHLKCPTLLPSFQSGRCFFTKDRSYLDKADIVFVALQIWLGSGESLPQNRPRSQYWTFFDFESPAHLYHTEWKTSLKLPKKLQRFATQFNWSSTFRLDSTIPVTFGRFEPLKVPDFSRNYDRFANKSAEAFYMATAYCNDRQSHRDQYVAKLVAEGIDVETIGGCQSPNKKLSPFASDPVCIRTPLWSTKDGCTDKIGAHYKFYLSFENSLCKDYHTEKFYRAVATDTIPVVLNALNMSLIAPPHSYIDVKDFESPKQLAAYLKQIGSNATLYNSYFWWKPYYNVVNMLEGMFYKRGLCQICAYAHKLLANPVPAQIDNVEDWWVTKANCTEGHYESS